jgi:hypothetical protein
MMKTLLIALTIALASVSPVRAFGPEGHKMVGAIADQRLKGKATADQIKKMLDGIPLSQAALIPDEIKSWDFKKPIAGKTMLRSHPAIEKQMIDFHKANPHNSPGNDHHAFHFTDVPVEGDERYSDGKVGRSNIDIVHIINYCIRVLEGEIPEDNPRKITGPVAVILLAHLVGDIHQPLHVGAEYFDDDANPVNPDTTSNAQADTGGNAIVLVITGLSSQGHGHGAHNPSLHSFWDDAAVSHAIENAKTTIQNGPTQTHNATDEEIAIQFATSDPGGLDGDGALDSHKLSEAWADEILPLARNAHERLDFSKINVTSRSPSAAAVVTTHGPKWMATEKAPGTYADFAGKAIELELHKAGWRLASLLERTVK